MSINEMQRTKPGLVGASPLISVFCGPRERCTRGDQHWRYKVKRILTPALAVVAALSGSASSGSSTAAPAELRDGAAEEQIRLVEQERNRAILAGDAATLDRMTSEDYSFITQRGELRTKPEILDGFRKGSFSYSTREVSDLAVRVYGEAAVVTGRAIQKGTEKGKDYSGENRFTRVYVKQGDKWVSVALQVTLVAKP